MKTGITSLWREDKRYLRILLPVALPLTFQNLMSSLVSASDAIMLGFLDQTSLSAVSLAVQVQFVHSLFLMAATIGVTILTAQYWGRADTASCEDILGTALRFSTGISIVFTGAALLFPRQLMKIFTSSADLIEEGALYLRIVSFSYFLTGISQVYLSTMKSTGRVRRSTLYGSSALLLNLLLNALFIYGFHGIASMGIAGAALATVISRAVECLLTLTESFRKNVVKIRFPAIRCPSQTLQRDFWKATGPVLANSVTWGCATAAFSVIMGHLGSDAVAANSIGSIVKNIIASMGLAMGNASGIIIGAELGSSRLEKAREYADRSVRIVVIIGFLSGLLIMVLRPLILHLPLSLTAKAHEYLSSMLYVCAFYLVGKFFNSMLVSGIFSAGADTRFGFLCDLTVMWGIIIPSGALAAFRADLPVMAVYLLLNLDETLKMPFVYHHYKKYGWVRNLTHERSS